MKNALIICFLLITVFAKGQLVKDTLVAQHYQTKDFDCAVFNANSNYWVPRQLRFTPAPEDIDEAEFTLRTELWEINKKRDNQFNGYFIDEHLKDYQRQYVGYIDKDGNRILFINAFKSGGGNWLKDIVRWRDGGSSFWQVKFNLKTKKLFEFRVNGIG